MENNTTFIFKIVRAKDIDVYTETINEANISEIFSICDALLSAKDLNVSLEGFQVFNNAFELQDVKDNLVTGYNTVQKILRGILFKLFLHELRALLFPPQESESDE